MACNKAPRWKDAAATFVAVVKSRAAGLELAAELMPPHPEGASEREIGQALEELRAALRVTSDPERLALLRLLHYDMLRAVDPARAAEEAPKVAGVEIPEETRSDRVYGILLKALQEVAPTPADEDAWSALDRAIRRSSARLVPGFLLLKGRLLAAQAQDREDRIRAIWAFLRVSVHFDEDARAAQGLLEGARLLALNDRLGKAEDLLKRCIAHRHVEKSVKDAALQELARVRAKRDGTN